MGYESVMGIRQAALAVLGTLALGTAATVAQARDWIEARIDDFVLVTDADERYARATLRDFVVFKHALGVLAPLTRAVPRMPTYMYALAARDWRDFAPSSNAVGFFVPGVDANHIVFDRASSGIRSREIVFHEYVHFVLHAGATTVLPAWLDEGTAEVFSSLRERQGAIEFGLIPEARRRDFAYFDLMPTATLFAVDRDSRIYRGHGASPMFYAQSWLTAHYMQVGNPERGRQTGVYLQALTDGLPIAEAVQAAYGVSISELDEEIRAYRRKGRIGGYRLHFDAPLPDASDVEIRPLPEASALARLAIAGVTLGRGLEDAAKRAERALKLDPALPLAQAALAKVRLQQGRSDEALELSSRVLAAPAGAEATAAAARVQWQLVAHASQRTEPADDEASVEELIDAAVSAQRERVSPSPEQTAMLQAARTAVLPFAGDPDQGISATLTVVAIDALLADREPGDTLALVQQAVTLYPTHVELAVQEAHLCVSLGRYTAALASASRAARYARSPEYRRRLGDWVADLEAAADPSR